MDTDGFSLVHTESGESLNAHFSVVVEEPGFAVYLESRSGALDSPQRRNPDYNLALWYLLSRLAASNAVLLNATVESKETRDLPLSDRGIEIGSPYPVSLERSDPSDLRLQLTRGQRTVGRSAFAGHGGNNTKRIKLLVRPGDAAMTGDGLRDLLVFGAVDGLRDAVATIDGMAGRRGQGFASDSRARKAVELRAMAVVRSELEAEGWVVADVSRSESYDFHCRRRDEELRVEVKGTRGGAGEILVTANEVKHAREHKEHVALAVVSAISVRWEPKGPTAAGGTTTWHRPWAVDLGGLVPLAFSWRPPASR